MISPFLYNWNLWISSIYFSFEKCSPVSWKMLLTSALILWQIPSVCSPWFVSFWENLHVSPKLGKYSIKKNIVEPLRRCVFHLKSSWIFQRVDLSGNRTQVLSVEPLFWRQACRQWGRVLSITATGLQEARLRPKKARVPRGPFFVIWGLRGVGSGEYQ